MKACLCRTTNFAEIKKNIANFYIKDIASRKLLFLPMSAKFSLRQNKLAIYQIKFSLKIQYKILHPPS